MTRPEDIEWDDTMLRQVPRPAPPTPSNPQMKPINVDRLVAREMERKGLPMYVNSREPNEFGGGVTVEYKP